MSFLMGPPRNLGFVAPPPSGPSPFVRPSQPNTLPNPGESQYGYNQGSFDSNISSPQYKAPPSYDTPSAPPPDIPPLDPLLDPNVPPDSIFTEPSGGGMVYNPGAAADTSLLLTNMGTAATAAAMAAAMTALATAPPNVSAGTVSGGTVPPRPPTNIGPGPNNNVGNLPTMPIEPVVPFVGRALGYHPVIFKRRVKRIR